LNLPKLKSNLKILTGVHIMKKVWKWVIGIVVVLVILAVLVGGAFVLRSHMLNAAGVATRITRPVPQVPGNGQLPGIKNGTNGNNANGARRFPGMMPFGNGGWGMRGMRGFGMMGFGRMMPFGGVFGGLVSLGFLALVVLGIIWLLRSLRKPVAPLAVAVASGDPVVPAVATHPCQKCGEPVHEDWKFCPNCSEKV
jgi:hypothetical protein